MARTQKTYKIEINEKGENSRSVWLKNKIFRENELRSIFILFL
jgi:hypothetical protein